MNKKSAIATVNGIAGDAQTEMVVYYIFVKWMSWSVKCHMSRIKIMMYNTEITADKKKYYQRCFVYQYQKLCAHTVYGWEHISCFCPFHLCECKHCFYLCAAALWACECMWFDTFSFCRYVFNFVQHPKPFFNYSIVPIDDALWHGMILSRHNTINYQSTTKCN